MQATFILLGNNEQELFINTVSYMGHAIPIFSIFEKFWRNDELDKKEIKEWNTIRSLIGKAGFQIET